MNKFLIFAIIVFGLTGGYFYLQANSTPSTYVPKPIRDEEKANLNAASTSKELVVEHIKTPENVKSIYMTACVLSTVDFKQSLVDLIDTTEINSIVIDIKDFSGTISFPSDNPKLYGVQGSGCKAKGVKEFIEELHKKNIY